MHHEGMRKLVLFLSAIAAFGPVAGAQHISVGIVGGVPFTGGLTDFTPNVAAAVAHSFSDSNDYLVGPMVDIRLPLNLGIEVDALYRPVNITTDLQVLPNPEVRTSKNYATWEFPILGKYRLPFLPIIKPFVEAGPSFRATGSSLSYFSSKGFTFGGGLEVKILRLRIAPAIRYTHWGSDSARTAIQFFPGTTDTTIFGPSQQNQAEFLVGLSF
jgi:hypothetical protein